MDLYKQLYLRLFNRVTDALILLDREEISSAKETLIRAQQEAEEQYLAVGDGEPPEQ